jgi:hypothetical protein
MSADTGQAAEAYHVAAAPALVADPVARIVAWAPATQTGQHERAESRDAYTSVWGQLSGNRYDFSHVSTILTTMLAVGSMQAWSRGMNAPKASCNDKASTL